MKLITLIFSLVFPWGCGSNDDNGSAGTQPLEVADEQKVNLEGNVVSAFALTVDNTSYDDIEDYYSYVSMNLNDMVSDLGYDDYDASFEAELGFSDLTNNMIVYLSPVSNSGYQSRTAVRPDGSFKFVLPEEAIDDIFQLRAVKRISVVLNKPEVPSLRFCFNFNAVLSGIQYEESFRPVALKDFTSTLTTYKCGDSSDLPIPEANAEVIAKDSQLPIAISKVEILNAEYLEDALEFDLLISIENEGDQILTGLSAVLSDSLGQDIGPVISFGFVQPSHQGCGYAGQFYPDCALISERLPHISLSKFEMFRLDPVTIIFTSQDGRQAEFEFSLAY